MKTKTLEIIKDVALGQPMPNGAYVLRLTLQNGDYHDIDLSVTSSIDEDGHKDYQVRAEAS